MAITFPWTRGTEAARAANSTVPAAGMLAVTSEGNVYAADGSTAWNAAQRLAKPADIDARTITDVVAVAASGALALNKITQVDASAAARTMTLPTGAPKGTIITVEKADSSLNTVTISGNIRGTNGTLTLSLSKQLVQFVANAAGSWNPNAGHATLSSLGTVLAPLDAPVATAMALRGWYASVAYRDNQSARLLVISHSYGDGVNLTTTDPTDGYVYRLKDQLASMYPFKSSKDGGYIPAFLDSGLVQNNYALISGTAPTNSHNYGFGDRCVNIPIGTVITITFTGTSIRLVYPNVAGAAFGLSVDGGGTGTLDQTASQSAGAAGAAGSDGNYWQSPVYTAGTHVVTITGAGTAGGIIDGWHVFNTNETGGIHVTNASHGGYSTANAVANSLTNLPALVSKALSPTCVFIMLMANDYHQGVPSATVRANLNLIISTIRGALTISPSFVIGAEFEITDASTLSTAVEPWANYLAAGRAAAIDSGAAFFDVSARMPSATIDNTLGLISGDKIHPTKRGHAFIGDSLAEFLTRGVAPGKAAAVTVADSSPWHIQVNCALAPASAQVGNWVPTVNATCIGNAYTYNQTNLATNYLAYDLMIGAGTWSFDFLYGKNNGSAILLIELDDGNGTYTTIGSIDTYAASASYNNATIVGNIVVPATTATTNKRRLRITPSTRNASNTAGYYCQLQAIQARRTA